VLDELDLGGVIVRDPELLFSDQRRLTYNRLKGHITGILPPKIPDYWLRSKKMHDKRAQDFRTLRIRPSLEIEEDFSRVLFSNDCMLLRYRSQVPFLLLPPCPGPHGLATDREFPSPM
jgi:hypothetical protein